MTKWRSQKQPDGTRSTPASEWTMRYATTDSLWHWSIQVKSLRPPDDFRSKVDQRKLALAEARHDRQPRGFIYGAVNIQSLRYIIFLGPSVGPLDVLPKILVVDLLSPPRSHGPLCDHRRSGLAFSAIFYISLLCPRKVICGMGQAYPHWWHTMNDH